VSRAQIRLAAPLVFVVAAWLSAGTTPLLAAAVGALSPPDFARDYVVARARLADGRGAPPLEGEEGNTRAAEFGAPAQRLWGAPFHAHPPPARLPVLPLGLLSWDVAALVWAAGSILALGWLAISLLTLAARGRTPSAARVALTYGVLALWPPTLYCLEKGQWSIWLAALLADGLVALEAGQERRAGVVFALGAVAKATPLALLGLLALRFRRAALAMAATIGLAVVASLVIDGTGPWGAFFGGAARNVATWAAWNANTASLAGITARLFGAPGPFARPWIASPALATALFDLSAAAFVLAALRALRGSARVAPLVCAAWLALPVLANPLGWSHVLVLLLAPLVVAFRDGAPATRRTAWVALALFSIPPAMLVRLAGPLPLAPARGLVLGLPALAAVALFVALLLDARPPQRPAPAAAQS
jgi:hypothetical protein